MKNIIYLDNAATTKIDKNVIATMNEYFTHLYGNPSSMYEFARKSKDAMEEARKTIADTINALPEEIFFTSGGTESDNYAIYLFENNMNKNIVTSTIEHKAILNRLKILETKGMNIKFVDVDNLGMIKLQQLKQKIDNNTALVSVMMGNNEVGTIEPVKEIGNICKDNNIFFHTDAVQAYGHIPIDVRKMNIDLLSASAHKFNGPKGVGFIYISKKVNKKAMIYGGGQEMGLRSGTENVPSIVGMAMAAKISVDNMKKRQIYITKLKEYFNERIIKEIPDVILNGSVENRLPGNSNLSFLGINNNELLAILDLNGICASGGSACSMATNNSSHVLAAMKLDKDRINGAIRFTLSQDNTIKEINYTIEVLKKSVFDLRKAYSYGDISKK